MTPDLETPTQVHRVSPMMDEYVHAMIEVDEVLELEINTDFYSMGEYWALENWEDHEWYDARRLKDANIHGYGFSPASGELVNLDSLPISSRRQLLDLNPLACRKHETLTNEWRLDATHFDPCTDLSHPNHDYGLSQDHDSVRTTFVHADDFVSGNVNEDIGRDRGA